MSPTLVSNQGKKNNKKHPVTVTQLQDVYRPSNFKLIHIREKNLYR